MFLGADIFSEICCCRAAGHFSIGFTMVLRTAVGYDVKHAMHGVTDAAGYHKGPGDIVLDFCWWFLKITSLSRPLGGVRGGTYSRFN